MLGTLPDAGAGVRGKSELQGSPLMFFEEGSLHCLLAFILRNVVRGRAEVSKGASGTRQRSDGTVFFLMWI